MFFRACYDPRMNAPARTDRFALGSIILAHASVDMQTISLAALLPGILTTFNLDYTTAAAIVSANSIVIAVAQPLFGVFGDRRPMRWLALIGCALCGLMMASVTWLPSYWMIIAAAMLSGVGSALFHPEGIANARLVGGANRTQSTSLFFTGGNIGFGLGPLLVTWLTATFGPHGALGMIVPTLIGCMLLFLNTRKFARSAPLKSAGGAARSVGPAVLGFVGLVLLMIILRSVTTEGLKTFVPLRFERELGYPKGYASPLLTTIALAGILGTLISGWLVARLGNRTVIFGSMVIATLALWGFQATSALPLQIATLAVFGIAMTVPWTVSVAMVSDALPNSQGLAAGLTLGTAYGAGGIGVWLLGRLADSAGLSTTLRVITWLPVVVIALSLLIPANKLREPQTPAAQPAK
jgi:MFS transporter, FSR family, fosmidomycin resistance protein